MLGCNDLAVLWRNHTGKVRAVGELAGYIDGKPVYFPGRWHTFGLAVGSADLIGVRRVDGRFVSIEVKSLDGRVRPEQHLWRELVRANNGLAGTARSVEDARAIIRGESNDD